jgi:hypothetical protein
MGTAGRIPIEFAWGKTAKSRDIGASHGQNSAQHGPDDKALDKRVDQADAAMNTGDVRFKTSKDPLTHVSATAGVTHTVLRSAAPSKRKRPNRNPGQPVFIITLEQCR